MPAYLNSKQRSHKLSVFMHGAALTPVPVVGHRSPDLAKQRQPIEILCKIDFRTKIFQAHSFAVAQWRIDIVVC